MHPAVEQIRQYLQLIALQFVQHPEQAELRVAESPQGDAVRFRLILEKTDVARIIGRNGMRRRSSQTSSSPSISHT